MKKNNSQNLLNELSENDFYQSSSYYSKLGYVYGNVNLTNKRYALYNIVFDTNKKPILNNASKKRDLTIIRDVLEDFSYVTTNSLARFLKIDVYDLRRYSEILIEPVIIDGITVKNVIPLTSIPSLIQDIDDNWNNVQVHHKNIFNILKKSGSIDSFVKSYDKNALQLRLKKDMISVAEFLGLPVKYHVRNDLVTHIKTKLYDEYRYNNCLDVLGNIEKDSKILKDKLQKVQNKIKKVDSSDYLLDRLSNYLTNNVSLNPSLQKNKKNKKINDNFVELDV